MPSKKDKKIRLTPTQKLKEEIKILKSEIDLSKEKNLRIKAEFENYKKRKEKEFSLIFKYEGESVIISILTVLDDLIRLENALPDTKDSSVNKLIDGIHLITNKINKKLKELEVFQFGEVGDIVDHELHEALLMKQNSKMKDNQIIEVYEKGYRYKDKVIIHAKVVVNQTPS